MTYRTSAAAQSAAIAQAVGAMGALVRVDEAGFHAILARSETPLVLSAPPYGLFRKTHRYATSYRGFIFITDTKQPITFGRMLELVEVKYIGVANI